MDVINLSNRAQRKRGPNLRPGRGSVGSSLAAGAARRPRHIATAVAAVIAVGLLAGCGTATAPGGGTATSHPPASKATLSVKFVDKAHGVSKHWMLRCDPVGGTTPDGAAVCRMLRAEKNPFGRPLHVMCPMILYSGRQIIISGTWFGQKVHRVFIDGGCDLPIFNQLSKAIY
jgi:hypothetical protein